MNRTLCTTAIFLLTFTVGIHKAQAQKTPEAAVKAMPDSDKVDIKDLENQYWSAKDTDFSVVQNRTYSKEKRFSFSAQYGPLINDPYSDGNMIQYSANYFWQERYGIQLDYQVSNLHDGRMENELRSTGGGAGADYNRMRNFYGIGFNYVPIYAKMSFLNRKIIYFDLSFTPLIGMTEYDQVVISGNKSQSAFTYGFDISQYFFFSQHFAIRTSIRDQWFGQTVLKYSNSGVGGTVRDETISNFQFLVGLTFFL